MSTFKVTFEMWYPEADDDIRQAYVIADSFEEAERKVVKNMKGEYEGAHVISIEKLDASIFV